MKQPTRPWIVTLGLLLLIAVGDTLVFSQTRESDAKEGGATPLTKRRSEGFGVVSVPMPDPGDGRPSDTHRGPKILVGASPDSPVHGTNVRAAGGPVTGTQSEISMASSGSSIVLTFNGGPNGAGFATSVNGGVTFQAMASPPVPMGAVPCCDPAVVADTLGRFYFVQLFRNDGAGNCTNSLHVSNDGGQTFSNIVGSPFSFGPGANFPDMPHMGIDRENLVGGQPQLYVFSRHFTSGINCPQTGGSGTVQGEVVCSTNGGTAWTAPIVLAPFTDTAHLGTGSDGSVYIVGNGIGGMAGTSRMLLRRSTNSCQAGLAFGAPVTVADNLTFGAVGVDREFPQPYVAVDRENPNIAYVAWSSDRLTSNGDRDIFLARCTFAGTAGSCGAPVRVNDNPIADGTSQYFPMLCVDPNNTINLSWNDQRAGARSTAIFHAEATRTGSSLSVGTNFLVSEANFTPANFGGTPDYGDYNENNDACNGEHMYAAWTSQVSPPGITPASNDPDVFFAVINNLADINVQAPLDFGDVCTGGSGLRSLTISSVGDEFLQVTSVTRISGSTDIVVEPSPPNPVLPSLIAPGGQLSFDVRCTPSSPGLKTATIRVASNDPDEPTLDLTARCTGASSNIELIVPDDGNYGDQCAGSFADQDITINNSGSCGLRVTNITSSSPAFSPPSVLSYPLLVAPGASLAVPIRFNPASAGPKAADITFFSNDPVTPTLVAHVTGNAPPGVPVATGNLDFGSLCIGASRTDSIHLCNEGEPCALIVTRVQLVGPDCDDLTLLSPNPPPTPATPLLLAPASCTDFVVRFQPDDFVAPNCRLEVDTDDPANPTLTFPITAAVGKPVMVVVPPDLTGSFAFPPTVVDADGHLGCYSDQEVKVKNTGVCPLVVTGVTAAPSTAFQIAHPPTFPVTLQPNMGHLAVKVRFDPTISTGTPVFPEETTGTLTISSNDPVTDPVRDLCGEAVESSGARVLVLDSHGGPIGNVDRIWLDSTNVSPPTHLQEQNVALQSTNVCGNAVKFHLNRENLPPTTHSGSYKVKAKEGDDEDQKTFELGRCEFKRIELKVDDDH